ncbi:ribosomal L7Ae/L30e/S12e/Gadd45 family protein [Ruminococcus sp. Marseille-P6503]|uniref:L7Ae/L30e/S12e/Gadd45 family ribosomal protein n=1 Tax=Ruminococcus sp. Marseille-P6503 TaxID=2364796 RepID=UPI000F530114|nr:ribosomal L7Ae/L30e/S12e/Gadd45 family protein [Ruminococcus sp. Marseille-P6503]
MNSKMGLVTMCRKAGKLQIGMDMVKAACQSGSAAGVFIADDLSSKSLKEIKFVCSRYGVELYALGLSMDEIWADLGKRAGVLAVTDNGLCRACAKGLEPVPASQDDFNSKK